MEKIITIKKDRVVIEKNGEYYEKPIKTLEQQEAEMKELLNDTNRSIIKLGE